MTDWGVALAGKRILVVEDEVIVAMLIEDILSDAGAAVVGPVGRVAEALNLATAERLDAAILDVNLAGETTAPVAEALRARGVPFAFATGYGASGLPAGFEEAALVQKPFQERDLGEALVRLVTADA
ncbi:response regulator [Rubellimicrobium sp. CFH 75288]|uniref:response regulator n=1 Tax=Rubellimicrobium sp. CFH 75288 TaxID=2697034 RepID=UPI00352B77AD